MKRRRRGKPAVNPRSARAMLSTLKSYAGDFSAITLTQGDLTISVNFNGPQPKAQAKKPLGEKAKKPAVALLSETPPQFDFEERN